MTTAKRETRVSGHHEIRKMKRDGDVWYAKLRLADGKQTSRRLGPAFVKPTPRAKVPDGHLTESMAEARVKAILAGDDALVNVNLTPTHVMFEQACTEHIRWLRDEKQRKPSTITDYESVIKCHLVPFFGATNPVEDITTADVEDLKDHLLGQMSHRTAQKVLLLLSAIMKRAKRKGWVDENPCEHAEKVNMIPSEEFNVLSIEQVHAVARAAASPQLGHLITVAAFTGMRRGELLGLQWRDVDFAQEKVHVRRSYVNGVLGTPKSHKRRSVPLSVPALVALDALSLREHFTGPDDLVFPSVVGGYSDAGRVTKGFYAALKAAGLGHLRTKTDPMVFHELRHTFGSLLAAAGEPFASIKVWMGHSRITTTERYIHFVPSHEDAARLTAAFTAEPLLAGPKELVR